VLIKFEFKQYKHFLAVCDFRLDFESFDIAPPANTIETADDHACQDTFVAMVNTGSPSGTASATGTTSSFNAFPVICGNNQGQHSKLRGITR
jgi:hypothetical protein